MAWRSAPGGRRALRTRRRRIARRGGGLRRVAGGGWQWLWWRIRWFRSRRTRSWGGVSVVTGEYVERVVNLPFAQTTAIAHQSALCDGTETCQLFDEIVLGNVKKEIADIDSWLGNI